MSCFVGEFFIYFYNQQECLCVHSKHHERGRDCSNLLCHAMLQSTLLKHLLEFKTNHKAHRRRLG